MATEVLFKETKSDIVMRDDADDGYTTGGRIVLHRQAHNGQWRFYIIYGGRVHFTGKGDTRENAHDAALIYLRGKGFRK